MIPTILIFSFGAVISIVAGITHELRDSQSGWFAGLLLMSGSILFSFFL